jgi:sugar/nucleoside kinase (ribokinase family)
MTGRLIQLSGVIVDHIYRVEAVPRPGEEAIVHAAWLAAGGGFNAMVAARRAGMDVAYAGGLGTGPFAEIAHAALEAEQIVLVGPRISYLDQGCCTTLIDASGERTFIASEGADGQMRPGDLASLSRGPEDWLLLSGYALGYNGSRAALTGWLGQARGLRLVFDPSPLVAAIPQTSLAAVLHAALWISANAAEARALTGHGDPAVAAATLAASRPAAGGAIVRDAARGCHIALAGGPSLHLPGHPVRPVDTNGAGDAHVGAFIAALGRHEAPANAAALANVAAALSTLKEGPSTAPTLAETRAAMARAPDLVQQRS